MHDPFLMKDMKTAAERLQDANKNEKIMVFGDYDVMVRAVVLPYII